MTSLPLYTLINVSLRHVNYSLQPINLNKPQITNKIQIKENKTKDISLPKYVSQLNITNNERNEGKVMKKAMSNSHNNSSQQEKETMSNSHNNSSQQEGTMSNSHNNSLQQEKETMSNSHNNSSQQEGTMSNSHNNSLQQEKENLSNSHNKSSKQEKEPKAKTTTKWFLATYETTADRKGINL